jgi:succinoglycan biosynthesis transport protein ExoP
MLQGLRSEYLEAKRQVAIAEAAGKGENHPDVKAAVVYQEASRQALLAEVDNIRGAALRDLQAVEAQLSGLNALNAQAKQRAMDLNINEIEYKRLERSKDNTEKLYSLVLERAKESDLTGQMRFNNVQVVDRPLLPGAPVRPRVTFTVILGAVGGLLLGVGLALGRELLDTSVKTPDDIKNEGRVAFLGLVPRVRASDLGGGRSPSRRRRRVSKVEVDASVPERYALEHPTSGVSEALRAVRTNLQFMSPDKPFRRLLVTSAGPAEGKTTMGCGLAIAFAQAGQRVLLVDCDLRRPRLQKIFRTTHGIGVTSAVINPELLDEVSLATDVKNLDVLPAGPLAPNPAEILQSDSFARLLDRLNERYDRVVIDSPPTLPVTDAAILSTMADGTVIVVRAFATSRHMFAQAVRSLQAVGANIAGGLLNAVDLSKSSGRYQYYYYQRGYASDESVPPPSNSTSDSTASA